MPLQRHVPALLAAFALAVFGAGCGQDPSTTDPNGDGNDTPTIAVFGTAPNGARRGPILLSFQLAGAVASIDALRLELHDGGQWKTATTRWIERDGADVLVAWDSFADVERDATLSVRLVAIAGDEEATGELELSVRNDPETDRLVVVGHTLEAVEGGGVTNSGKEVSVFTWRGGAGAGVQGLPRRLTVGAGPAVFRAAPHGRATLVLEENAGTLSLLETPLDGDTEKVTRREIPLPAWGSPADVQWSGDGRAFFVSTFGVWNDAARGPSIWRYEPSEDLSELPEPTHLFTLPGPPSHFAVDPVNGFFLAACGPGATGVTSKLVLYGPDGTEIDRIEETLDYANDLAIHPQGGFAVWTSDFSGAQIRRFRIGSEGIEELGEPITTVEGAAQLAFHPATGPDAAVVVVGNGEKNSVTPLVFEGDDVSIGTKATGISLAYELDIIERGSHAGTVLAPAVTQVIRVTVTEDGVATKEGVAIDFGDSTENIVEGIAIQR